MYARRNSVDRIHVKDVELSQSSAQHTHVRFQHDGLSSSPLSEIGKTDEQDEQDARQSESASTDGLASPGMPSLAGSPAVPHIVSALLDTSPQLVTTSITLLSPHEARLSLTPARI